MSLLDANPIYKPMHYPEAYQFWEMQQAMHWIPKEVPLSDDVRDWQHYLTVEEKYLLTQIFRFFTQADIQVNDCYMQNYAKVFKPTEVKMMLAAFSNMETIHIAAYAYLLDTINMPEIEYKAFMLYKEMKDKYDYMNHFNVDSKFNIAITLGAFGAFGEGLQLFASFAMLFNFTRHGKMKGMGQIVSWSIRDETLHIEGIIWLFHTFIKENPELWNDELRIKLVEICKEVVEHEDAFIDLAFNFEGAIEGITKKEMKLYIRYIADRRLKQLGLDPIYHIDNNPLIWFDSIVNAPEFGNFFETRVTEYSKGATTGDWDEVFADFDRKMAKKNIIVDGDNHESK